MDGIQSYFAKQLHRISWWLESDEKKNESMVTQKKKKDFSVQKMMVSLTASGNESVIGWWVEGDDEFGLNNPRRNFCRHLKHCRTVTKTEMNMGERGIWGNHR